MNGVGFSSDGKLLASAGDDHTVKIWDTTDWRVVHTIPHAGEVVGAAFTPDGTVLATAERQYRGAHGERIGEDVVRLWDIATWEPRGELRGHTDRLQSVSISDDGMLLASGSSDGSACLWDIGTGEHGGLIRLWDYLRSPDRYRIPHLGSNLPNFAFSPDSRSLLTAASDLRVFNLAAQTETAQLAPPSARILSATYSPDGKVVVSGDSWGNVVVRNPESLCAQATLVTLAGAVTELTYTAGGRQLAAQVASGRFKILDPVTGRLVASQIWAVDPVNVEEFACNCDIAVGLRTAGTMELWKEGLKLWQTPGPINGPAPAISTDCRRIARGFDDGTIHIWNTRDGKSEFVFVGDSAATIRLAFSPDGRTLAGVTTGNTLKLWNVATGHELLAVGTGLTSTFRLAFSPDGSALAVSGPGISGQGEVIVWQAGWGE